MKNFLHVFSISAAYVNNNIKDDKLVSVIRQTIFTKTFSLIKNSFKTVLIQVPSKKTPFP